MNLLTKEGIEFDRQIVAEFVSAEFRATVRTVAAMSISTSLSITTTGSSTG